MSRITIVGGGLSGVYAALLLECCGLDCAVLEAQMRLGRRIESSPSDPQAGDDAGPPHLWCVAESERGRCEDGPGAFTACQ